MKWNDKTVVVTGAGGFIGSHLTERLVQLGAKTRAFVRYTSNGSWGWLDQSDLKNDFEVFQGDIRDHDTVVRAVADADIVFHLAALIAIPYSYHAPLSYVRTNVEGTLNVLQAVQQCGSGLVVHTSTSEVYGTARTVPIDENHPLQGQSPYSATKIGADKIVEAFHLSFGLPAVTIRPFNTYGPRQSARAVIPTIVTQALAGAEIRLGNLEPTRDLNYVLDTVEGFVKAAETPEAIGQVINLGTGQEISIRELAEKILKLLDSKSIITSETERVRPEGSEVERLCADNRKGQTLLGWSPKYSLEEGLKATIEWIRENSEQYRTGVYVV